MKESSSGCKNNSPKKVYRGKLNQNWNFMSNIIEWVLSVLQLIILQIKNLKM